tara:strand:+ start:2977 stop:3231 length:255 start_codon:yes stop_codon:yes gene_type:complete
MSIQPQHLLVEEKGLSNQIKRLKDLVPTKEDADLDNFMFTPKYLQERLISIIEDLEVVRDCLKTENDRILKDKLFDSRPSSSNG